MSADAFSGASGAIPGGPTGVLAADRHGDQMSDAAAGVGVSVPVGMRWFRHAGGMPLLSLTDPTSRYLSFAEQCTKSHLGRKVRVGVTEVALVRARVQQADPA